MIIELKIKNFKSIKNEVVFSMVSSSDEMLQKNLIDLKNFKLSKCSMIYGANGSGKTTILSALSFIQTLILSSINTQVGDKIFVNKHKLALNESSSFELQFISKQLRYVYGFSIGNDEIIEEYLYYFPNGGRQNKVFERASNELILNSNFTKALFVAKSILKPNKLFLSCAANFADENFIEQSNIVKNAFLFFKEDLIIYAPLDPDFWLHYSVSSMEKDLNVKDLFVKLMNGLGSDMLDVNAKINKRNIIDTLPKNMPEELKKVLAINGGEATIPEVKISYGKFILDLNEESFGTRKLFNILCPIIHILEKGKVLIYDEIETSLHESIVDTIFKLFLNSNHNSQMICTTHNTNMLNLSKFRRDQIWFTELNPEYRNTDLYSLADIKNVRNTENIRKGYIEGKYGAIPCLNIKFIDELGIKSE